MENIFSDYSTLILIILGILALAIKKGNRFIRVFFLIVVSILIARYGYDVFKF